LLGRPLNRRSGDAGSARFSSRLNDIGKRVLNGLAAGHAPFTHRLF
jgi:hypothetical protein